jgi:hypothetical protein
MGVWLDGQSQPETVTREPVLKPLQPGRPESGLRTPVAEQFFYLQSTWVWL